ncbi:PREDICTED: SAC3 domain-containing protein 1 [Dufourea novaeangliae]|uniref:80 kDa MCM3-associated protein n=1 Tax=Dufourea novaeangliae TaxID=178035 RepID=A0A154PCN2_DUFNO|nr:PREDICTED: SAC3 domain-containing protein 1 [Dufourea novaeangliae]KZC09028.1 80 kDa MCM3-associated protein [Dufourea novaeangliae]
MTEIIQGTCLSMCPEKERWMRERKCLLHNFEIDESTKGSKRPKADPMKVVKSFGRPAAGLNMTDPNQLRPASILLATIRYLFTKITTRTDVDWTVTYDFVFDRLRAVRQDVVIQRIDVSASISIFEPIVRFLIYSAQRLCTRTISEFDATLNNKHISECISHLLALYDEWDKVDGSKLDKLVEKLKLSDDRQQMEALYIILNMGNTEALTRALTLPLTLRRSSDVQLAMKISFAWYLRNYARVCSLIQQLSPILVCAAMINISNIRRTALRIMSSGYNSKVFTFPGMKLQELLLYKDIQIVEKDCKLYGLEFTEQNILLEKAKFKGDVQSVNSEMYFTEKTLHDYLPRILLEYL